MAQAEGPHYGRRAAHNEQAMQGGISENDEELTENLYDGVDGEGAELASKPVGRRRGRMGEDDQARKRHEAVVEEVVDIPEIEGGGEDEGIERRVAAPPTRGRAEKMETPEELDSASPGRKLAQEARADDIDLSALTAHLLQPGDVEEEDEYWTPEGILEELKGKQASHASPAGVEEESDVSPL